MTMNKTVSPKDLDLLMENARRKGATDVIVFDTSDIVVEDHLADRCREPRCGNYGLSRSCPPHVGGPSAMRENLSAFSRALFFRIEVPHYGLHSDGYREIFQLLHETAAGIEGDAAAMGYKKSKAFAGNSSKEIFCHDHLDCAALGKKGVCRHPREARPSMSGFGIHVAKLMEKAGWPMNTKPSDDAPDSGTTSVCGLVLIG